MGLLPDYSRQAERYDETRSASPSVLRPLRGALAERAAGRVAEDPGASRRGERIMLERELLLDRGDPGVAEQR